MNRKQKIIISVTGIFIVMLILVGLTYAYFLTQITGNTKDKSISVTTADLRVVYGDGTKELLTSSTKLVPSSNAINTKDFTVTNTGDSTEYAVIIENVRVKVAGTNTLTNFESNDFKYTLTCTKSDGSSCNGVSTQTTLPMNDNILVTNEIDSDDTHTYVITLWYLDNGRDQSADMNKTLEARINIEDPNRMNPYSNNINLLSYKIINNALNVSEEQQKLGYAQYRNVPLTDMTTGSSETGVAGIYSYEVIELSETAIQYTFNSVCIGDSIEEAKSCKTHDNIINSVGKYVYDNAGGFGSGRVIYSESYDSSTNILTYKNFKSESTLSKAEDDYGTSFYYRGGVKNNYVSFAGFTWRIVRINGDGSIRLILDGTLNKVAKEGTTTPVYQNEKLLALSNNGFVSFNENMDDSAYIGYMYGEFTGNSTSYDQAHKNEVSSTIKTYLDTFYEEYLSNYSEYLGDTLFCGDKSLNSRYSQSTSGFGMLYAEIGKSEISLECAKGENNTYSRYTVNSSKTTKGIKVNDDLNYPIALLSKDESIMAGAHPDFVNKSFYLFDVYTYEISTAASNWWTMTAYSSSPAWMWYHNNNEFLSFDFPNTVDTRLGVRPVINLKADSLVSGGNGTYESPYTIG